MKSQIGTFPHNMAGSNLLTQLDTIDLNDLVYVERDLNFAQKVRKHSQDNLNKK